MNATNEKIPDAIWQGDWRAKIAERVNSHNCDTITSYLSCHQGIPYFKVARSLGNDIAAIQVAIIQFEEAKANDSIREAAKDALCRAIRQHIKHGWENGIHFERMCAGAYAGWLTSLEFRAMAPELVPYGKAVWQALVASNPSTGWMPDDGQDINIANAFDIGWPTALPHNGASD